ncbi:flavodoxin family protein [Pedobacter cryotolerans]|uniref:Flavodoxin n=1 Tax=Pedobacter cryotolerans TaxID=2571270 RepID=A0A4U1C7M6_9SPHI|nr:flavodoxin [Pedobacter cryotolerans]TKC01545.1 flavodoxin [Pedobacter cryotolerans]
MRRINVYIMLLTTVMFCFFTGCSNAQVEPQPQTVEQTSSKILVLYLSRTNNTKTLAEFIHKNVGGDLVALELQNPYPQNYQAIVAQVAQENESGYLPALATKVDVNKYDIIYFGFPTWGMQLPPPMKSFLKNNDLSGKTLIPFNSNAGYGIGSTFETIKSLAPKSKILEGFSTKGGIERDGILFVMEGDKLKQSQTEITTWLKKIGQLK